MKPADAPQEVKPVAEPAPKAADPADPFAEPATKPAATEEAKAAPEAPAAAKPAEVDVFADPPKPADAPKVEAAAAPAETAPKPAPKPRPNRPSLKWIRLDRRPRRRSSRPSCQPARSRVAEWKVNPFVVGKTTRATSKSKAN